MKVRVLISYVLMMLCCANTIQAAVVVPQTMKFADMTLEFTPAAREKIQKDVDMIMRNPTYFQQKVERANLFFPIVEKVFNAQGFPTDFKYLSLQESSLISDAVSSSNAVGFWQFKKESAIEVGVRVDGEVDERMNIVASSLGASKYLTRNNAYYKNWIYTLLSYNLGFTGAKSHAQDKYIGVSTMKIGEDMHWYVIRFLAHMLAYQGELGKSLHPQYRLEVYVKGGGKTLSKIATDHQLSSDEVVNYNKWALKGHVPTDREYYVILPVAHGKALENTDKPPVAHQPKKHTPPPPAGPTVVILPKNSKPSVVVAETGQVKIEEVSSGTILKLIKVNKVKAVVSRPGDQVASLAFATGITMEAFRHFNEMQMFDEVKPGKIYYLQLKRSKAITNFHTAEPGETLWDIAQRYGVKTSSIMNMNRMGKREALRPGRVLWMNKTRPKDVEVEYKKVAEPAVIDTVAHLPVVVKDTHRVVTHTPPVTTVVDEPEIVVNSKVKQHTVVQGETMYSISRTYQIPVDSLMKWNQLKEYSLKTGQILYIENPFETAPIEHVVQPGETMYAISKKYQVTIDQIKAWNHKSDTQLKPGEVILIKKTQ